jgi:hypothetical protein
LYTNYLLIIVKGGPDLLSSHSWNLANALVELFPEVAFDVTKFGPEAQDPTKISCMCGERRKEREKI